MVGERNNGGVILVVQRACCVCVKIAKLLWPIAGKITLKSLGHKDLQSRPRALIHPEAKCITADPHTQQGLRDGTTADLLKTAVLIIWHAYTQWSSTNWELNTITALYSLSLLKCVRADNKPDMYACVCGKHSSTVRCRNQTQKQKFLQQHGSIYFNFFINCFQ